MLLYSYQIEIDSDHTKELRKSLTYLVDLASALDIKIWVGDYFWDFIQDVDHIQYIKIDVCSNVIDFCGNKNKYEADNNYAPFEIDAFIGQIKAEIYSRYRESKDIQTLEIL